MSFEIISLNKYKAKAPERIAATELQPETQYSLYARLYGPLGKAMTTLVRLDQLRLVEGKRNLEATATLTGLDQDFIPGDAFEGELRRSFWIPDPARAMVVRHALPDNRTAQTYIGQTFLAPYDDGWGDWEDSVAASPSASLDDLVHSKG